ncbi:hypothetical protein ACS0TY_021446 [Phlomoides rotata]
MSSTYWCYRCNRFVRVGSPDSVACPDCNNGFIEEVETPTRSSLSDSRRRRFPAAAIRRLGRNRRNGGDRSPFNPVIVLRGPNDGGGAAVPGGGFELFFDDGVGSVLRPLPATMSEILLGSGFDRLLDQLAQIECVLRPVEHAALVDNVEAIGILLLARPRIMPTPNWRLAGMM